MVNYQKRLLNAYKKDKNMKLNEVHKKLSNYINDKVQFRDNPEEARYHTTSQIPIVRKKLNAIIISIGDVYSSPNVPAKMLIGGSIFRTYSAMVHAANMPIAMTVTIRDCLREKNTHDRTM